VFLFRLEGRGGSFRELIVTGRGGVLYRAKEPGSRPSVESLARRQREVGEFLAQVEALGMEGWPGREGGRAPRSPGAWTVVLETPRGLKVSQGGAQRPAGWQRLRELVERLSGRAFPADPSG